MTPARQAPILLVARTRAQRAPLGTGQRPDRGVLAGFEANQVLPDGPPSRLSAGPLRQAAVLQLGQTRGNRYVQGLMNRPAPVQRRGSAIPGGRGGAAPPRSPEQEARGRVTTGPSAQRRAASGMPEAEAEGEHPAAPARRPLLVRGAKGPPVTELQQRLNAVGTEPALVADGDFGRRTSAAVVAFQRPRGLKVDGKVGDETWAALDRETVRPMGGEVLGIDKKAPATPTPTLGAKPVAGGEPVGPAHLDPIKESTERADAVSYGLDWDAKPAGIDFTGEEGATLRGVFDRQLDLQIKLRFGPMMNVAMVLAAIRFDQVYGFAKREREAREKLWRAKQYAVVETLKVEKSKRYQRRTLEGQKTEKTFCITYATDVVNALGAYLPAVWWSDQALARIQTGETVKPVIFDTVLELNADGLNRWMQDWGRTRFGWKSVATANEAQAAANGGNVAIILASHKPGNTAGITSGHVNVVLAESRKEDFVDQGAASKPFRQEAVRDGTGEVAAPLQSNAAATNFRYGVIDKPKKGKPGETEVSKWWENEAHEKGGFWVYHGEMRDTDLFSPAQLVKKP